MHRDRPQPPPGIYRNAKGQVRRLLAAKDGHFSYEAIMPRVRAPEWLKNYRGDHGLSIGEYQHDCWHTTWQKWYSKDGVRLPDDWKPEGGRAQTMVLSVPYEAHDRLVEFAKANGIKVLT